MGCVFYELTAAKKSFIGDIGVERYTMSPTKLSIPEDRFSWQIVNGARREDMEELIENMLLVDMENRPSTLDLLSSWSTNSSSFDFDGQEIRGGMTEMTRAALLCEVQIPAYDLILCLDDDLVLLQTHDTGELQLWSSETSQCIDKFKPRHILPGRFATSLDGSRYVFLDNTNTEYCDLVTGKLSEAGITEDVARGSVYGPNVSRPAISNQGYLAFTFPPWSSIGVYTGQHAGSKFGLEQRLEYEKFAPRQIEIDGDLIYSTYCHLIDETEAPEFILWNWRAKVMLRKCRFRSYLGVYWYRADTSSPSHIELLRSEAKGKYLSEFKCSDSESGESKTVVAFNQDQIVANQVHVSRYGNFIATWQISYNLLTVNIWSVPNGKLLATVDVRADDEIWMTVAISPKGKYLLATSMSHPGPKVSLRYWRIRYSGKSYIHRAD